jgi:ArsR family transcriptional regulator
MLKEKHNSEAVLGEMSMFFKILSDKTRLRILTELLDGSLCVNHICERLDMSQSAISHQLALLRKADLVRVTRKGKTVVYSISDEHVRLMLDMALLHACEEK